MIDSNSGWLGAFLGRNLAELAAVGALPAGLPLVDVAAALDADPEAFGRFYLGDPAQEAFWCPAVGVEGFDDTIKIWFRDGIVVKLDGEWPELAPEAIAVLGAAELQLDHRMDVLLVEGGEHVWPSKGIAVKLNRQGTLVVGLSTFQPTTADGYRTNLKTVEEYRESPSPSAGGAS
jgi:hypothetical protein